MSFEIANMHYRYENGVLYNKFDHKAAKSGKIAGTVNNHGRHMIKLDGKLYQRSHIVFLLHNKRYPFDGFAIDHINRNRTDDRIENLREVSHSENAKNRRVRSKLGITGVAMRGPKQYRICIVSNGKQQEWVHTDFFEACCIRKSAEARLGGFI